MSPRLGLGLAGAVLLLAAVLVALAIDVQRSAGELSRADLAFELSGSTDWDDPGSMPMHVGRRMLGVGDDLAFRRAAERYETSRADSTQAASSLGVARASREAERSLDPIASRDRDRRRRASAANLLGILAFEAARQNPEAAVTLRERSLDQFRAALRANPNDGAAKFNLELAFALSGQGGIGTRGNGRGNQAATVGAVVSPPGQGY
jgi:hypothetical protein